ncbi:DUF6207 family protein [Streptomyces sp. NPDC096013]|uniref:DUF6207 family protein n=1 Tax=Streptomyces sp. NPDC096013 TaxID=3366069 RepID=UPI00380AFD32
MKQTDDAHVAFPGLAVVEVATADDETAFTVQELLAAQCAVAPADRTDPGARRTRPAAVALPGHPPGSRSVATAPTRGLPRAGRRDGS